jgi:hypothetical protein
MILWMEAYIWVFALLARYIGILHILLRCMVFSATRDTLVLWISLAYMGEEITKIGSFDFVKSSGEGYFALKFR